MKLYFIRHGQTDWNLKGMIQGSIDTELNETGIKQAEELCSKIISSGIRFSKIYTSRQKRALKTAQIISNAVSVEYIPIDGLEEVNLGDWEGLSWKQVEERYPADYEDWYNNRRYTKVHNGESYQDMLERVLKALNIIIENNNEDVAIVTHNAVIMCLQCYVTDTPFEKMGRFKAGNANITIIDSSSLSKEVME